MSNFGREIWKRGIERGEKEAHRKDAIRLYKKGEDVSFIAEMLNESVEKVEEWVSLVPAWNKYGETLPEDYPPAVLLYVGIFIFQYYKKYRTMLEWT